VTAKEHIKMTEDAVFDAVSSKDGRYFAVSNLDKTQVILYSSEHLV
jgi:hypothetical protein